MAKEVKNYIKDVNEITAPISFKSAPDSPEAMLAYVTKPEIDLLVKATIAFEEAQEQLQKGNLGKYQELIDQAQQYVDLAIDLLNK